MIAFLLGGAFLCMAAALAALRNRAALETR
jgi:hypothetical protein